MCSVRRTWRSCTSPLPSSASSTRVGRVLRHRRATYPSLPTQDKKKKKRKASSSSSSDDDSADGAAAAVGEPAYDDGVGGADVLPRRLAHFEALLTDALERRPAKKKRGNML